MKKHTLAALIGCAFISGTVWAEPPDAIKALLEQNKPFDAYNLARGQPGEMGKPAFDFYYGIAAIDAGHAGEGVLALERYLLSFPDNRSARFQLARGYFILGEDQRAQDEFQELLTGATGNEKAGVERYLAEIRARSGRYQPTYSAHVEFGVGHDSNINSGFSTGGSGTPGFTRVKVPGLGSILQPDNSPGAEESDAFTTLSAGAQGAYPILPGVSLFGAIGVDGRFHGNKINDQFDQGTLGGSGGVSILRDRNLYKLGLGFSQMNVDNQSYVQTLGLNGEWQHQFDQLNRLTLGAQIAELTFDDMQVYSAKDKSGTPAKRSTYVRGLVSNKERDSNFFGLMAGWTRVFNYDYMPVLNVSANYGQEVNQGKRELRNAGARNDLSRDIVGLRVGLNLTPAPKWGAAMGIALQQSDFKDKFIPGNNASEPRSDQSVTLDGSVTYFYSKEFSVRGELQAIQQKSNVGLYEYDRYVAAIKARYEFK